MAIASLGNEITELKSPPEVAACRVVVSILILSLTIVILTWFENDLGYNTFGGKEAWSEGVGEEENR